MVSKNAQAIKDGFQQRPMQRYVLTLLDFSKAYDTVWTEELLLNMAIHLRLSVGYDLFSTTAEHASNSLLSSAPVVISPRVYLKVPFLHRYYFCSTLTI